MGLLVTRGSNTPSGPAALACGPTAACVISDDNDADWPRQVIVEQPTNVLGNGHAPLLREDLDGPARVLVDANRQHRAAD